MGGKTRELKGRIKEAAGALTDDDKRREAGKLDQEVAKSEQAVENAIDAEKKNAEEPSAIDESRNADEIRTPGRAPVRETKTTKGERYQKTSRS